MRRRNQDDRARLQDQRRRRTVQAASGIAGAMNRLEHALRFGRVTDGQVVAVAALSHAAFFALTWAALDTLLTGRAALLWIGVLTLVTAFVLAVDWSLFRMLYDSPVAGGLIAPLRALAWGYLSVHAFLAMMLLLMWGFSFLGALISVMLAA